VTTLPDSYNGLVALSTALQESPALTLNFYSYGIMMHCAREGKGTTEYPVSPAQLASVLSAKVGFETGLLSSNTLYIATEGIKRLVIEYRPPQKTALFLEGSETPVCIPLPGLVLVRATTANENPRYAIYAVKKRPTSLDDPLYLAPLPNTDRTGICWGTVKKPSTAALGSSTLDEDWTLLLGSIFTNHSLSGKSKSHPYDIRLKYIEMEKHKSRVYSTRDLHPAELTLASVIRKVRGNDNTIF
jgi:hypothetical protein